MVRVKQSGMLLIARQMLKAEGITTSEDIRVVKYSEFKSGEECTMYAGRYRVGVSVTVSKVYGVNIFLKLEVKGLYDGSWHPYKYVGTYYSLALTPLDCIANSTNQKYLVDFTEVIS